MQVLKSGARHGCYTGIGDLGWYKLRTHGVTLDVSPGHSIFVTTFNDTVERDSLHCDPLDAQQLRQVC